MARPRLIKWPTSVGQTLTTVVERPKLKRYLMTIRNGVRRENPGSRLIYKQRELNDDSVEVVLAMVYGEPGTREVTPGEFEYLLDRDSPNKPTPKDASHAWI